MSKSRVAIWRDAVRDSDLKSTPKLVAHTLATYMNSAGLAYPSKATLAAGASLSVKGRRAVDHAIDELEAAGFLVIDRSRGRSSHRYSAALPTTAHEVRRSEWATAQMAAANSAHDAPNSARGAHESVESAESTALNAPAAVNGAGASACTDCGLHGGLHIDGCSQVAQ